MKQARADHAMLYFKGSVYVFGGMAFSNSKNQLQSLKSCEVYSVKDDKWTELPSFEHAR